MLGLSLGPGHLCLGWASGWQLTQGRGPALPCHPYLRCPVSLCTHCPWAHPCARTHGHTPKPSKAPMHTDRTHSTSTHACAWTPHSSEYQGSGTLDPSTQDREIEAQKKKRLSRIP